MPIDDKPAVVDKAIVVDALEDIRVNITVSASNKYTSFNLHLVLLATLLLLSMAIFAILTLRLVVVTRVFITGHATSGTVAV